jgi:hypothetical protein
MIERIEMTIEKTNEQKPCLCFVKINKFID